MKHATLQFNFVGRLLGPRGNSLKRVEATTGCRVYIRGKGSIKDPDKVTRESHILFPGLNKVTFFNDWSVFMFLMEKKMTCESDLEILH